MRRRVAFLLAALSGLALGACGTLSPLQLAPPGACTSDTQCKGERICVKGACVWPDGDGGPTGADGGPGFGQDAGPGFGQDAGPGPIDAGVPGGPDGGPGATDGGPGPIGDGGTGPATGAIGAACQASTDCADPGAQCYQSFPGGYCLVPNCSTGTCPTGSACVTGGRTHVCLQSCNVDGDCRTGYTCSTFFGPAVCVPAQGGGSTPVGGACTVPNDCAGTPAICLTQWPGGYCTTYNCHQDPCAAGSSCIDVSGQSLCFEDCTVSGDCGRPDYVCQPLGTGQPGACIPRCDQAQICSQNQTCDATTGLCH